MIRQIIKHLRLHLNLCKTLYFNLRVFRLRDALRFPVLLYGNLSLEGIHRGCITLENPKLGGVKIGGGFYTKFFGYSKLYKSHLRIEGKLIFGNQVIINQGGVISVDKGATLKIGDNVIINMNTKIRCVESITIDENCRIGWDCQIFDTSFHYMIKDEKITYRNSPVHICHNSWATNGVSIMKGTQLPPYSVVAAKSLVNKNLMEYGENCMFAGTPAKFICKGVKRILGKEDMLDAYFTDSNLTIPVEEIKEKL